MSSSGAPRRAPQSKHDRSVAASCRSLVSVRWASRHTHAATPWMSQIARSWNANPALPSKRVLQADRCKICSRVSGHTGLLREQHEADRTDTGHTVQRAILGLSPNTSCSVFGRRILCVLHAFTQDFAGGAAECAWRTTFVFASCGCRARLRERESRQANNETTLKDHFASKGSNKNRTAQ